VGRLPIRIRLTAVFTLAVIAVIAGAALFVYTRLESDLDDAINDTLSKRADAIDRAAGRPGEGIDAAAGAPPDSQDGLAQVVAPSGRLLDASGGYQGRVLGRVDAERAARRATVVERNVPGIDASTRILARAARVTGRPAVVVVGQSLEDRNETLANVERSFAIGGPVAVILVSLLGYGLATAGLAPMEAMRRRAREISLAPEDDLLPLPKARDEVRRLGQTLNEMLERLRASFERERQFVADASHELRTRGLPVRPEPIRAHELLDAVRDRFADRAAERGRSIRVELDGNPALELRADPLRMRQALGNLVDNALRHGHGDVVLRARALGGTAELRVEDSGDGFDPAIADRAFERFSRGRFARGADGSGLGLAIVRAVAEAHGGSAAIVTGNGAAVRLTLPNGVS